MTKHFQIIPAVIYPIFTFLLIQQLRAAIALRRKTSTSMGSRLERFAKKLDAEWNFDSKIWIQRIFLPLSGFFQTLLEICAFCRKTFGVCVLLKLQYPFKTKILARSLNKKFSNTVFHKDSEFLVTFLLKHNFTAQNPTKLRKWWF